LILKEREFWTGILPYPTKAYAEGIPLAKLVAVAIFLLQKAGIESSFNNIAIASYKLFPEKFKMVSFPEYPDFVRIDNTLRLDCKKTHLIDKKSNRRIGFPLSNHGEAIAEETVEILHGSHEISGGKFMGEKRRNRQTRLVDEISKSSAFKKFATGQTEIPRFEIVDFLHGTLSTDNSVLRESLEILKGYAKDLNEFEQYRSKATSVMKFLQYVEDNWGSLLARE
jgi:hypothetical protein